MRVAMIGTGYVGLVSGTCFADFGHTVICIDKDARKIDALNSGQIPIYEPGLQELVAKNVAEERLYFTTDPADAIKSADAVFIAVGTPTRRGDGHADLSYVYAASEEIAGLIDGFTVIVTKSTVPVGTGDEVEAIIAKTNPDADFAVVSNPEFLREGAAIEDFKRPDRVVVGTENHKAVDVMRELYRPLYLNETPILVTKRRTSELIKYAGNAFLAVKITFINEIADLCEKVGANVQEVSRGIGLDNRIGNKFLNAGPGYGGSCFPKDTLALSKIAASANTDLKIVDSVIEVNAARKKKMADKVIDFMGGDVSGKTVALLGLAFKPNTDDMREAPSLDIVEKLQSAGTKIRAYDPASMEEAGEMMQGVLFCDGPYHALEGADVVVIVTEWDQFRALDLDRVKTLVNEPNVVDLRNIYKPSYMAEKGFNYTSIGRAY
ncbi:MAG: UDP-glucose/GDP-mannose dehydrogenase family protein [Roseibium sp.]